MTNTTNPAPFSDEDFEGLADTDPDPWGWEADAFDAQWDDDPSPYDGTYSEM